MDYTGDHPRVRAREARRAEIAYQNSLPGGTGETPPRDLRTNGPVSAYVPFGAAVWALAALTAGAAGAAARYYVQRRTGPCVAALGLTAGLGYLTFRTWLYYQPGQ